MCWFQLLFLPFFLCLFLHSKNHAFWFLLTIVISRNFQRCFSSYLEIFSMKICTCVASKITIIHLEMPLFFFGFFFWLCFRPLSFTSCFGSNFFFLHILPELISNFLFLLIKTIFSFCEIMFYSTIKWINLYNYYRIGLKPIRLALTWKQNMTNEYIVANHFYNCLFLKTKTTRKSVHFKIGNMLHFSLSYFNDSSSS